MSTLLTPAAYQNIVEHAWSHILKGGGVVPDDGGSELEDAIAAVASTHFGADELRTQLENALAALDHETGESLFTILWGLVGVYGNAGFTLGATVAIQIGSRRARPSLKKATARRRGMRKGSRSRHATATRKGVRS